MFNKDDHGNATARTARNGISQFSTRAAGFIAAS